MTEKPLTHWLLPNEQVPACGKLVGDVPSVRDANHLVDCSACRVSAPFLAATYRPRSVGVKYDQEKLRWELLPFGAVEKVVEVMTRALTKYPPGNWKTVPDAKERYFAALMRHLVAWRRGEANDQESGLPHLAHAGCDLLFVLAFDQKTDGVSEEGKP